MKFKITPEKNPQISKYGEKSDILMEILPTIIGLSQKINTYSRSLENVSLLLL